MNRDLRGGHGGYREDKLKKDGKRSTGVEAVDGRERNIFTSIGDVKYGSIGELEG